MASEEYWRQRNPDGEDFLSGFVDVIIGIVGLAVILLTFVVDVIVWIYRAVDRGVRAIVRKYRKART